MQAIYELHEQSNAADVRFGATGLQACLCSVLALVADARKWHDGTAFWIDAGWSTLTAGFRLDGGDATGLSFIRLVNRRIDCCAWHWGTRL